MSICAFWCVCVSPFFYVSWAVESFPSDFFSASVTNFNEPHRDIAASTIAWVAFSSNFFPPATLFTNSITDFV